MITLGEGNTPLIKCNRLGKELGIKELYIKDESRNPTWSFKDRHCCVAIAKGLEFGAKIVSVSSYGNMGASTAAYAARAGIPCIVFVPSFIPKNMLTWLHVYGAMVVPVTTTEGRWTLEFKCLKTFDDWYSAGTFTSPMPVYNPYGVEGNKTITFEICEQMNWKAPDKVIVPTSYGGGLWGIWKGFKELLTLDLIGKKPEMVSVETNVLAPLAKAISKGLEYVERVSPVNSVAFSIAGVVSSYQALKAIRESSGITLTVSEEQIVEAQKLLASREGIYGEMASVAAIAGVKKLIEEGRIERDETVVCVLTSSGLKFPEVTASFLQESMIPIAPKLEELLVFVQKNYGYDLTQLKTIV
jgi:threonine synthase